MIRSASRIDTGVRQYATTFPATENPISEGGRWINGATTGLVFSDMRTTSHFAFGTQTGTATGNAEFADSTACLTGLWGPTQDATITVGLITASSTAGVFEEVEIRLRSAISANTCTGYEINTSVATGQVGYIQVVRWNGPLNNWTVLHDFGPPGSVNGDTLRATISGTSSATITVWHNGTLLGSTVDATPFTTGAPGIGHYIQGSTGLDANYGISAFSCSAS